ncbi:MAG: SDR family oxidoreductase [Erysipelotrichaceae bacterium]
MAKRVLITGGSRGIGLAIAKKFTNEGYIVEAPPHSELDLSSDLSVDNYICSHKTNGYDVIVNNAGINDVSMIDELTDENIDQTLQINLISPIKLLRGFIPLMKKKTYGRIINIGSIWGVVSKEGRITYSASKNAIHGVTNTLAIELGQNNILVNTVCPVLQQLN